MKKTIPGNFSFSSGIPVMSCPETPGSIHEGYGELGYAVSHDIRASDNPDLIAGLVIWRRRSRNRPFIAAWHLQ